MKRLIIVVALLILLTSCGGKDIRIYLTAGNDHIEVFSNDYEINGCSLTIDDETFTMERTSGTFDKDVLGTYMLTFTYDVEDETFECKRAVYVVDYTSPVATLNAGIDTLVVGNTWTDTGVTSSDNYYETLDITINSEVDTTQVGTYVVQYIVEDGSGNSTSVERIVNIIE